MRLDVPAKLVLVAYEPGPGRPEASVRALEGLGDEARLVEPEWP